MKKRIKMIVFAIVIAMFTVWLVSLFRCELLTLKYGAAFEQQYLQTNILAEADNLKVLNFTGDVAEIYYITSKTCGNVMFFEKRNDAWVLERWKTVWSTSGSASGVIWPYWWHIAYGGF